MSKQEAAVLCTLVWSSAVYVFDSAGWFPHKKSHTHANTHTHTNVAGTLDQRNEQGGLARTTRMA